MWPVEHIAFRSRDLDFTSAGLGRHPTTSIVADNTEIVNAIDLLDLDTDDPVSEPVQVIVCELCGTPGCNSGNRVFFSPDRRRGRGMRRALCDEPLQWKASVA
jgi:hypothetical protein